MSNLLQILNTENPYSPYFVMKIRDKTYDFTTPNYLQSLRLVRRFEYIGEFDITLCDISDENFELEELIIDAIKTPDDYPISFQYGWSENKRSPWYRGVLLDYTPTFLSNLNMTLSIKGIVDNAAGQKKTKTYRGDSVSSIIEQVAKEEKWVITNFVQTDKFSENKEFYQSNMTSIEFIRESLVPQATKNGNEVRVYHTCTTKGTQIWMVEVDPKAPKVLKNTYNFPINAGNYGNVLSFSPNYSGAAIAAIKTERFVGKYDNKVKIVKTGDKTFESHLLFGGTDPEMMTSLVSKKWFDQNMNGYEAMLEIIGDPTVMPMDYVNVIPIKPNGELHHTGGTYFVKEVIDEIGTNYKTILSMVKIPGVQAKLETVVGDSYNDA